jgi:hypothetical protein
MRKGIVGALVLTGSLLAGPAALAAPVEPSGALPGTYTPQHAGHDHGKKDDKKKDDDKKKGDKKKGGKSKHWHGHSHYDHHHHHHHDGDSAHASGGYDSHREHPRYYR